MIRSRRLIFVLLFSLLAAAALLAASAEAQSLTVQNGATLTVEKELDVPGSLSESGSSALTFDGGALTLSGSSEQSVGVGPISVSDFTLDNSAGAVLNSDVDVGGLLTLTSGVLTTNGHLTLTSASETATAAISETGSGSVSGQVTFERTLAGSGSHFRMLSAPTGTTLDGTGPASLLSNVWTQATGSGADAQVSDASNASVYTFDETAALNGSVLSSAWTDVEDLDQSFSPGEGFMAFLFADRDPTDNTTEGFPVTLAATGTVPAAEYDGSAVTPSLTYTGNDSPSEDGWNLIANPFMAPLDWESVENDGAGLTSVDKTIYVWNASANAGSGAYATYTADGSGTNGQTQYVAPFQAFFVKATATGPSLGGIEAGDKATGQSPEVKSEASPHPRITLRLRPEGATSPAAGEETTLRFSEAASVGKDAYDAYQLEPLSTASSLLASEMTGTDALFDHQNRPVPVTQDTVGLTVDPAEAGTYRLEADTLANLPGDWRVILKDMQSGGRHDVGAGETVTVEHSGTTSKRSAPSSMNGTRGRPGSPTVAKTEAGPDQLSFRLFVGPKAALPVEWAGFDATARNREVALTWRTVSETNNAGFAIQRRITEASDGRPTRPEERVSAGTWTRVGFVEGTGTTDAPRTYRFTDDEVPFAAEHLTYRLRQMDLDGTTTHSDAVTVRLGTPTRTQIHAPFPNPAGPQATLRYEVSGTQEVEIAVYDALGRRVRTIVHSRVPAGRHESSIQTSSLAPGTYFVRLQTSTRAQTRRLTILR